MMGPGKYDVACTRARVHTQAQGVILVVFGGKDGNGFSCQLPPEIAKEVPAILRVVADSIEADQRKARKEAKLN
jgi:spore coat polysaccharide biosynthesis predicted glycosyltransferase SpsG